MRLPLAARLSRFLVGCYPRRWRQRYAIELLEVLEQYQPTARTVLNLWASAVSAHLDPAYRPERHPMIRLRRWAPVFAAVAAVLLVFAVGIGYLAWQDWKGNMGPPPPLSQETFGVAFSPDGRTVATINTALELWDVADRAHPKRLAYSEGDIVTGTDPAFSPDGRVLATAGGRTVILWNVAGPARPAQIPARPTEIAVLSAYPGGVSAVVFSPDGHLLASASDSGTVVLRSLADPAAPVITATLRFTVPPAQFPGPGTSPDVALAFSVGGRTLTTIAGNTGVTLWNVTEWNVTDPGAVSRITTITGDSIGEGAVAFSPGGRTLAGAPTSGDALALWTLP